MLEAILASPSETHHNRWQCRHLSHTMSTSLVHIIQLQPRHRAGMIPAPKCAASAVLAAVPGSARMAAAGHSQSLSRRASPCPRPPLFDLTKFSTPTTGEYQQLSADTPGLLDYVWCSFTSRRVSTTLCQRTYPSNHAPTAQYCLRVSLSTSTSLHWYTSSSSNPGTS
jgi:hypothetical protein